MIIKPVLAGAGIMSSDLLLQKPDDRKMVNLVLGNWGAWVGDSDQPYSLTCLETIASQFLMRISMENTRDFRWVRSSQARDNKRWRENNRTSVWGRILGAPSIPTDIALLLVEVETELKTLRRGVSKELQRLWLHLWKALCAHKPL